MQAAYLQATSAAAVFLDLGLPVSARWCEALAAYALALAGAAPKATETLVELEPCGCPPTWSTRWRCCRPAPGPGRPAATWARRARTSRWRWNWAGRWETARGHEGAARAGPDGPGRQVADEFGALASKVDGELTATRLAYTLAAADKDCEALAAAATRFEDLGALLYPAEALGESAVHLRRDGASRGAAAAQQTAARLLARCEGAVTPFVRAIGARAQLTPAELDTALQAATGSSDKQIAELMNLSVRTVENRLHRAYQKLGLRTAASWPSAARPPPDLTLRAASRAGAHSDWSRRGCPVMEKTVSSSH